MKKMLRIVEIAWIVIAVLSAIEVYRSWPQTDQKFWIFFAFMIAGVFMFFFRRRQRLRYIQRQESKTE